MSAVADNLRRARALIESGWTQKEYARGKSGRGVNELGNAPVCFCALGAIRRVTRREWDNTEEAKALRAAILGRDIIDWNDAPRRTQADVLAAFDKAIELAEQVSA